MNLVTLDFETYFDSDYTLSKMTTEEYIRDPRFKAHMVGIREQSGSCDILTGSTPLLDYTDLNDCAVVMHHAHFDALILSHWYGVRPKFIFCTLSMARLVFPHAKSHSLGALAEMLGIGVKDVPYESFKGVRDLQSVPGLYDRVADGCIRDCDLTYQIFKAMLPLVPQEELRLIDATVRLFTEPALMLDRPRMEAYHGNIVKAKDELLTRLGVTKADLQSNEKFAELLLACGVEPPVKPSPSNPEKMIYAFAKTDQALKDLEEDEDERVSTLVTARLGQKSTIGETRARRLIEMSGRGALSVYLKYAGAHTLRWSGGDGVNWQNFTRGSELRKSIIAPDGYQVVVIDCSQVEARLVCWQAGQWDMLEKFRRKEDIYSETATKFYGYQVDKSKPAERGMGKQIILSCGFRAGADSIKETARRGTYGPPVILTDEQSLAARDLYRSLHPNVVQMWKFADEVVLPWLANGGGDFMWGPLRVYDKRIYAPNGAWLDYTHLRCETEMNKWGKPRNSFYTLTRKGKKHMHGGILVQNIIELMSRMLLANTWLQVQPRYRVVTCSHDELVYLAPVAQAEEALQYGLQVMKKAPAWCEGIPLDAEGGYAVNYSK